jgi:tetratricopeptide (TPR) repeat protein
MDRPGGRTLTILPWLLVGLAIVPRTVFAQDSRTGRPGPQALVDQEKVWYALGRVVTLAGSLVPGAKVAVYFDTKATPVQNFETGFHGEFEISLHTKLNKGHRLKVVAIKAGYLHAREDVDLTSETRAAVLDLVLRENQEDPDQLSIGTLVSSVGERLQASTGASPAGSERSETLRRARAFLDSHDTDGALELLAKAVEREPNSIDLRTLLGVAMLEGGSWSGGTHLLTETAALNAATEARRRRSEPCLILGVVECWRGNPQRGTELFLQALQIEPQSPLLHQELGRAYLLQRNWSEADTSLARAIQAGASPEARLLRAEALLGQGRPGDAQAEMQTYLGGRKPKKLPMPVRIYWLKLDGRMKLETASVSSASKPLVKQTPEELQQTLPELEGIEPAKDQQELPSILQNIGEQVEAFFRDFHDTISREEIRQEILHRGGKVSSTLNRSFQYLLVTWPDNSRPALDEYRTEGRKAAASQDGREQDFMLTQGFASAAEYFLPAYRAESTFAYLGRQRMEGHETHVVAFAQRPEVARLLVAFLTGEAGGEALTQGVAWVDRDTYQIIRMRTDLLFPVAWARLDRLTTEIHYIEVHFQDDPLYFWLPRDVVVTVGWKGKLLRNRHSYSDFHLFRVESTIKPAP